MADWPAYLDTVDMDLRPANQHVLIDNSTSAEPLKAQAEQLVNRLAIETP